MDHKYPHVFEHRQIYANPCTVSETIKVDAAPREIFSTERAANDAKVREVVRIDCVDVNRIGDMLLDRARIGSNFEWHTGGGKAALHVAQDLNVTDGGEPAHQKSAHGENPFSCR